MADLSQFDPNKASNPKNNIFGLPFTEAEDLFDSDTNNAWRKGLFMRPTDRKILMKSDYLRKEAELFIDYTSKGEIVENNNFMCKSLKEINEGSANLNKWVYEQTRDLMANGKLVGSIS